MSVYECISLAVNRACKEPQQPRHTETAAAPSSAGLNYFLSAVSSGFNKSDAFTSCVHFKGNIEPHKPLYFCSM